MRNVDEDPVFDQQIPLTTPPVANAHEQTLADRGLAEEGFRLQAVQRRPAAGANVIAVGKAGEMAGLAAGHRAADPFAERTFEGNLETREILKPDKAAEGGGAVPKHVVVPVGSPGFVLGGEAAQHVRHHPDRRRAVGGIILLPLQPVLGGRTWQVTGKAPVTARTVGYRPSTSGDHQLGDVEENIAFDSAVVFHPVKLADTQVGERSGGLDTQPRSCEISEIIPVEVTQSPPSQSPPKAM